MTNNPETPSNKAPRKKAEKKKTAKKKAVVKKERINRKGVHQTPRENSGRRPSITGDTKQRLITAIQAGNYIYQACLYAGINQATYFIWMKDGEDAINKIVREIEQADVEGREPKEIEFDSTTLLKIEFFKDVKKAEAESEVAAVAAVRSAWREDWRAAMTYLERRFPDRWGRRVIQFADDPEDDLIKAFQAALKDEDE